MSNIYQDEIDASMLRDGYNIRLSWKSARGVDYFEYSRDVIMSNNHACQLVDNGHPDVILEMWNDEGMEWRQLNIVSKMI